MTSNYIWHFIAITWMMKKNTSAKRGKNISYVWKLFDDDELKLWDSGSTITLFSNFNISEYKKEKTVGFRDNFVIHPIKLSHNFWEKFGVNVIGIANHANGYYHSRINKGFFDFIITVSGSYSSKSNKHSYNANPGECLILPPDSQLDSYVNMETEVIWIHLCDIPYWRDLLGDEIRIKRLNEFQEIVALSKAFKEEIFNKNRSFEVLEMIAEAFILVLRREFSKPKKSISEIKKILEAIKSNPAKKWKAREVAKNCGMTFREFDNLCKKLYAKSFSKILAGVRMKIAFELIKTGVYTNSYIAKKIGYSNAYSFSKAFSLYYKKSPQKMKSEFARPKSL